MATTRGTPFLAFLCWWLKKLHFYHKKKIRAWTIPETMKRFRNFPIQQKMLVMTLLICGAVLCVAIAALFTFQVLNFRSNFQRDTATLAVIIANNSTAAMAFKDDAAATEVVGSLQGQTHRGGGLPGFARRLLVRPLRKSGGRQSVVAVSARRRIPFHRRTPASHPAGRVEGGTGGHTLPAVRTTSERFWNCSVSTGWSFWAS